MKKSVFILVLGLFAAFGISAQPTPTLWLRADSATLGAASWHDVLGNNLDAVPSAGSMPAAFSYMNFNKCFEADGTQTFSVPLGANNTRQSDVIVVYETYDTVNENALWQVQLDSARRIGQTTRRILNDNGQITYDTANRLKPVVNYLSQSWRTPELCTPTLTLCTADSLSLNGRIAEAMYFDHRISDTAVIQWISYLSVKYGITLYQTDYLDSRCNVIWDYVNHPEFSSSIAGLGRDDSVGLNQKQTCFADGHIVLGVGQYVQTNEENAAALADGDFIVFGMDGVLPAASEIYMHDSNTYKVIGRSLAQVTGNAHTYGTFLLLDMAAVCDSLAPVLLVDRSGTGEFPAGEMEQVLCAGTDNAGHYIYKNIHWDTDLNGFDFFCFAVRMPDTMGTPRALTMNIPQNGNTVRHGAENTGTGKRRLEKSEKLLSDAIPSKPQYRLLPNPNRGRFTVDVKYLEEQDVTVTVYDAAGRLLLAMSGKGQREYRFEGRVQTAGHYLIDIVSNLEHKTLKMVVN